MGCHTDSEALPRNSRIAPSFWDATLELMFVAGCFLPGNLHHQADASRAQIPEDGLPVFGGNCARRKNTGRFAWKMLDEQRGHVRCAVGDRRYRQSAPADLVERRE